MQGCPCIGIQARTVVVAKLGEGWDVLLGKEADAVAQATGGGRSNAGAIHRGVGQDRIDDAVRAARMVHKPPHIAWAAGKPVCRKDPGADRLTCGSMLGLPYVCYLYTALNQHGHLSTCAVQKGTHQHEPAVCLDPCCRQL